MISVGLLPMYIALYDKSSPELRERLEKFYDTIAKRFEDKGINVIKSGFCALKADFEKTVERFEKADVSAILTLHMAYSPSLESAEVLTETKLPIIVLDTTETYGFGFDQSPDEILYNHGIHGVMDMCNMLKRGGKQYVVAAGHFEKSDVIDRVDGFIRAAYSAKSMSESTVLSFGGSFDGMGDFLVSDEEMSTRFGVKVVYPAPSEVAAVRQLISEAEAESEMAVDNAAFEKVGDFSPETHFKSSVDCLTVRKLVNDNNAIGYTANFQNIGEAGFKTMPFIEAGKSMARGVGYAGEGDVLTAAFTGAILKGFKETSFIEIFCPDWAGNTLFLSHMGEMNLDLAEYKPELNEKDFIFGEAENPIVAYGCLKSGNALFLNVFRDQNDFKLLISPVEMVSPPPDKKDGFKEIIRGWMKPESEISSFLEKLSQAGATHHSILVYGAQVEALSYFAKLLNMDTVII